jgi:hypothetical protein
LAHALCLDRARGWRKLLPMLPYAGVLLGWQLVYQGLGYGAHGSGIYLDVAAQPGLFAAKTVQHAWVLCLTQLSLPVTSPLATLSWAWLVAAASLGLLALVLGPLLRRSALARFYAVGLLLCALPFGATVPTDRILLPMGLGASGLLALLATGVWDGSLQGGPLRWTHRCLFGFAAVLSPLLFVPQLFGAAVMEAQVRMIDEVVPEDGTAVMLTVPTDVLMLYPEAIRHNEGRPWPPQLYTLHAGLGTVEITRCGPRCLLIEPEGGWLRNPMERLGPGLRIPFEAMTVQLTRVSHDGRPEAAAFVFERPLEQIHFLAWQEGAPAVWEPPAIDERVSLETSLGLGG